MLFRLLVISYSECSLILALLHLASMLLVTFAMRWSIYSCYLASCLFAAIMISLHTASYFCNAIVYMLLLFSILPYGCYYDLSTYHHHHHHCDNIFVLVLTDTSPCFLFFLIFTGSWFPLSMNARTQQLLIQWRDVSQTKHFM